MQGCRLDFEFSSWVGQYAASRGNIGNSGDEKVAASLVTEALLAPALGTKEYPMIEEIGRQKG